jgi:hypothetical protein
MSTANEPRVITIKSYYDRTITIDVDGEPVAIPIRVKRFSLEEALDFSQRFKRVEDPPAQRVFYRKLGTDEWDRTPVTVRGSTFEIFTVSDDEIRRRRLIEMSDDERARYEQQAAEDDAYTSAFCEDVIRRYVWIKPGVKVIFDIEGGQPIDVSTGESIVRAFAGNLDIMRELVRAIKDENTLSAADKQLARGIAKPTTPAAAHTEAPAAEPTP